MSPSFTPNWLSGAPAFALCLRRASSPRDLSWARISLTVMPTIIRATPSKPIMTVARGDHRGSLDKYCRLHKDVQIQAADASRELEPEARLAHGGVNAAGEQRLGAAGDFGRQLSIGADRA